MVSAVPSPMLAAPPVVLPVHRKLGKIAPRIDKRMLRFARYVTAELAPPPSSWIWSGKATQPWGQMYNDRIGDCTCAAVGHAIQNFTAAHGAEVTLTDSEILQAYMDVTALENHGQGFDPVTFANDNGAIEVDVLNYWRTTGFGLGGIKHKLGAYAAIHPQSQREVEEAIYYFGGAYLGVALPKAVDGQPIWTMPSGRFHRHGPWEPGSWGGHAVFAVDYDPQFVTVITWGELLKMSWEFFINYVDEAYALIAPEWVNDTTKSPHGFDMATLVGDLSRIVTL